MELWANQDEKLYYGDLVPDWEDGASRDDEDVDLDHPPLFLVLAPRRFGLAFNRHHCSPSAEHFTIFNPYNTSLLPFRFQIHDTPALKDCLLEEEGKHDKSCIPKANVFFSP